MTSDDRVDLDPEVLLDPLDSSAADEATVIDADASSAAGAIVPVGGTGLVRADPFRRYMAEIAQYPPLSREEEQELARQYRETGDRDALFRLVTANLRMVVRVAHSFRRAARNLLDLVQEGNLGLLRAAERFDPELGVRLPTYAAWWVRAYMVKFLLDNVRLVRVGTTNARRKLLRNLRQEKQRLEEQGYEVGPKLLADHFGVSEADVVDVEQALHAHDVSLDAPLGDDEQRSRSELFEDPQGVDTESSVARQELQARAEAAIAEFRGSLNEREQLILDRRILSDDPQTLAALGERFGVTREAMRQAEVRLMKRLTSFLRERLGDLGSIRIGPE